MISSSMSNYEFYQPMGAQHGRYPQGGAGGRAPVRASSVTDIHSLYSALPGMLDNLFKNTRSHRFQKSFLRTSISPKKAFFIATYINF